MIYPLFFNTPPFGTAIIASKQLSANYMILERQRNLKSSVEEEYEVQKIMDERWQGNRIVYFVKWKGYPHSQNTWEPKENLANAPDMLKEWKEKKLRLNLEFEKEDSGEDYRQNGKRGCMGKFGSEKRKTLRAQENNREEKIRKGELQMYDRKLRNRVKVWEKAEYKAQQNEDQIQHLLICTPTQKNHAQNQIRQQKSVSFRSNHVQSQSFDGHPSPRVETSSHTMISNPLDENIQSFESKSIKEDNGKICQQRCMVEEKQEEKVSGSLSGSQSIQIQGGDRICIEIESENIQHPSNSYQQQASRQSTNHQSQHFNPNEEEINNSISSASINPPIEVIQQIEQHESENFNESTHLPSTQSNSTEGQFHIPILSSSKLKDILPTIDSILSCFKCPQSNQLYLRTKLINGDLILIDYTDLYSQYPSILLRILERSLQTYDINN